MSPRRGRRPPRPIFIAVGGKVPSRFLLSRMILAAAAQPDIAAAGRSEASFTCEQEGSRGTSWDVGIQWGALVGVNFQRLDTSASRFNPRKATIQYWVASLAVKFCRSTAPTSRQAGATWVQPGPRRPERQKSPAERRAQKSNPNIFVKSSSSGIAVSSRGNSGANVTRPS